MSIINAAFFIKDATVGAGNVFRDTAVRVCLSCCTVIVLLWVAIVMYISFYYAYMPTVHHSQPVFLQFSSDCRVDQAHDSLCSFPEANISLSRGDRILMRGQRYQVYLDLDMPQSPVNEKLGMFMVTLKFMSHSGKVLATSSRSSMLHFKSSFLKGIGTMFMSLPLMLGFSEEKQIVAVKFFENYVDDSYHPVTKINVVVSARRIEIYSASLRIEAEFSGFRYILFNYPVTSALVCISTNFITACIVFFFAYHAFTPDTVQDTLAVAETNDEQQHLYSEARRRDLRSTNQRVCRTPSPPPSNNSGRLAVKPVHSRSKGPVNREPCSQFQPIERPPIRGRRLRSASFPQCRWDPDNVPSETDQDMGEATRSPSSSSCRGCQDMHSVVQMADIEGSNDYSGADIDSGRSGEGLSQVTTIQPLTYSNTKQSDEHNSQIQIKNKSKMREHKDIASTSRYESTQDDAFGGVDKNEIRNNDNVNERDDCRTSPLEKSLSFDSGVQRILPAFTVFRSNKTTNKNDETSAGNGVVQDNTHVEGRGLYMRRIPDGAPAEPSHTQYSSLTRTKSEEYCSPRDEEKTTVRKRTPNKTKSKFGSSFRKIIPRR